MFGEHRFLTGLFGGGVLIMAVIARSLWVALLALLGAVVLAFSWATATAVQLLATTALIMGGTNHPLSTPPDPIEFVTGYMADAEDNYIDPDDTQDMNRVAVIYPAQFFPVFGSMTFDDSVQAGRENLNDCLQVAGGCDYNPGVGSSAPNPAVDAFKVFGYSQSAVVASLVKQDLIDNPAGAPDDVEFFLIANPMRPNGGILARGLQGQTIPGLGVTFYGPTPTNTCQDTGPCYETTDVAQQYDLLGGDAPAVPWNLLAVANSAAAYYYLHGAVPSNSLNDPTVIDQGVYGDTHYYLIPAVRLPLLMPLEQIGVPGPILAVLDAPLRVIVEAGYARDRSPGEHVQFQLLPSVNPVTIVVNLAGSIPVGIDDGLQEAGLGRALGTPDVLRPFGVGGPTYPKPSTTAVEAATLDAAPAAAEETGGTSAARSKQDEAVTDEYPTPAAEPADTDTDASTTEATRPDRPKVRGPIEFDTPKAGPFAGKPLKRLLSVFTGQGAIAETEVDATESGAATDAAGGEPDAPAGEDDNAA
jgi:PE-PPE domain